MRLLKQVSDRLCLQLLCDALRQQGVDFRVDGEAMHALMPLPGIFDARVMVADGDWATAIRVLRDLGMEVEDA